tara:strand:- start:2327 stop:4681 length:2355 start_codon:yes stop_codon:yes gene_type:complete
MQYQQITSGGQFPYPNHDIDPSKKGMDWCREYAQAAYYDWQFVYPKGIFSGNGGDYSKFRLYALGKQPNSQYKKWLGVDETTNNTWLSLDWSIRSIVSGYRDKAISRLLNTDYNIVATPVDQLAKSEMDEYYADIKTRLMMREAAQEQMPELESHPLIAIRPGEPADIEELEMRMQFGEQFNRSKDAEMAINLAFYQNDYKTKRRKIFEDLFDLGVAGVKDYLGDDGKPGFRVVDPECVITSFDKNGNFSDIVHAGEIIDVPLIDLATVTDDEGKIMFNEDDLTQFASTIAGQFGNPRLLGLGTGWMKPYDKFKCKVLDIEFYTYNDRVYRDTVDEQGNPDFRKADFARGKKSEKYTRKKIQYTYKCKWVIGTDKVYDYGMCYDQKRPNEIKKKAKTRLSYTFYAYNFYQMKAQGMMERLIPYIDDYQLTMLKIQNFKNRAVPSGWWIDLAALEKVAMTKGGQDMQPQDLLQMFFDTGVLLGRSDADGGTPQSANWRPVIPIENTAASELQMFYNDLISTISAIEKMTGYNDVTLGQASSKTLVPGYESGQQSTNEALYPLAFSEENISLRLAEAMLSRTQQALKLGDVTGFAPAINSNSLTFMQISPAIAWRDYGIELEKRTTQDQKAWLMQMMQQDIANGFLTTADAVLLVNTKNVKEAQMIWAYRTKKEKERQSQQKMAEIQAQQQGNQQSAQIAQQAEMQKFQMQADLELRKEQMRIDGELQKEQMRIESAERIAMANNNTKIQVSSDTASAKENSTQIAGQSSILKQQLANQKSASQTK